MSDDRAASDLGAERDVDLRSIRDAIRRRIWIVAAGAVAGVILGGLYSVSGGSEYNATAFIAPGQAFNPGGTTPVLTYLASAAAINALVTSTPAIDAAAAKAGMSPAELRGHVSTAAINPSTGAASVARNPVLVSITVQLNRAKRASAAANALSDYIAKQTTTSYVLQSLAIYDQRLANYTKRIQTLQARIDDLRTVVAHPGDLSAIDQLVPVTELDEAEGELGSTLDSVTQTQQLKILANDVGKTQVIQTAKSERTTARSRRNSIIVGLILGLIVGIVVALVVDSRSRRPRPAAAAA